MRKQELEADARAIFMRLDRLERGYIGVEELSHLALWMHNAHSDRTRATEEELDEILDYLFIELDPGQTGQVWFETFKEWHFRAAESIAHHRSIVAMNIHQL